MLSFGRDVFVLWAWLIRATKYAMGVCVSTYFQHDMHNLQTLSAPILGSVNGAARKNKSNDKFYMLAILIGREICALNGKVYVLIYYSYLVF